MRARFLSTVLLVGAAALGVSGPAWAEEPELVIDDAHPAAALGTEQERAADPMRTGAVVMELIERANAALTAGDGPRAARYFEAIVSAAPEQALGHRKLCEAKSLAQDFDGAVLACRATLERPGATVEDHLRHLAVLLTRPTPPTAADIAAVDASLAHLGEQNAATADFLDLSCQFAQRLNDSDRLAACVRRLEAIAPEDARTAAYAWARAMRAHDEKRARAAFARARGFNHDPRKLEEMQTMMATEFPSRAIWYWAAGLVTLVGVGLLLSLRRRATAGPPASRTLDRVSSSV